MIQNYQPEEYNDHYVRLTLNENGYVGHIADKIGGNCKGTQILISAMNIIENYDQDDIDCLVENDCEFRYDDEIDRLGLTLYNPDDKNDVLEFEDATEDEVKDMVVGVEIIDCKPYSR